MSSGPTAPSHSPAPASSAQRHWSAGLYRAPMFSLGAALAHVVPLPVLRAVAGLGGTLYALTHPGRVAVVRKNLRLLEPTLGPAPARRVYAEFARTLADYFYIGTRPPARAIQIIAETEGYEHLAAAHAAGKGALIVTAHLGLFELGGLMLAHEGYPACILTFPEPSSELTKWRADFRRRWKVETIEIGSDHFAFLEIAERLRRGAFVASLIDRPHASENTPVRLPGGTAQFSAGILLLAAHTGAPVIPATMVRRRDGRYVSQVFPPVHIEMKGSRAETLQFYTQQIADTLRPVLCSYPEQWFQFVPLSPSWG